MKSMKPLITFKGMTLFVIPSVLACLAFLPTMQAQLPPEIPGNPDGCYPAFTTAEGCNALHQLGGGVGNTAVGWYSNFLAGDASFNTSVGAGTLALDSGLGAGSNTAVGTAAMILNLTGNQNVAVGTNALAFNMAAANNVAVGTFAMYHNDSDGSGTAGFNTAVGDRALQNNVDGGGNTAVGASALAANTAGAASFNGANVAIGDSALAANTTGNGNTAIGSPLLVGANATLGSNTIGIDNIAIGNTALGANLIGNLNVAVGGTALANSLGDNNTAIGVNAGFNITTGHDNIDIGKDVFGVGTENNTIRIGDNLPSGAGASACFIGGIDNQVTGPALNSSLVFIDLTTGKLGTTASSERFKRDINPMGKTSEAIFSLKPVTFHYKSDTANTPCFGLIAEEVAKVNPALAAVGKDGKPYTVRYDQINAMLLNEFLKEHKKVEEQQASISQLKSEMQTMVAQLQEQAAQIQKVSAQLEVSKPAPQVVTNEP
jgi:trimeric autotransporter adhesin